MSAIEYLHYLRKKNPVVLGRNTEKINITVASFEAQVMAAYNSGIEEGKRIADGEKSLMQKIFGG